MQAVTNRFGMKAVGVSARHFLFRWSSSFILLALIGVYEPWSVVPFIGRYLDAVVTTPLAALTAWSSTHVFHLSGIAATMHPTDSRDTALAWVLLLCAAAVSTLMAIVWSILDHRRSDLTTQITWVRFLTRMMLIFIMLRYGLFKVFPMQMSRPSLAVLNEPVGQSSPMTLLWTLIGMSPGFQILSGLFETACALLLCFRRTALPGTLLGLVVMGNVVLFNFCFDVPVKLGALLIFAGFLVLLWPDVPVLGNFFFQGKPAQLTSAWRPRFTQRRLRYLEVACEAFYILCAAYVLAPAAYASYQEEAAQVRTPSSLTGEWHVDTAQRRIGGKPVEAPVLTAEMAPMSDLYLEPDGRAMARSNDGRLWRSNAMVDEAHSTLKLFSYYFDGERFQASYHFSKSDGGHLRLDPIGPDRKQESTLTLSRVPLAANYPLLRVPFHWAQEWALER